MAHKLETGEYRTVQAFVDDAEIMFKNCRHYNPEDSIYFKAANKLEDVLKDALKRFQG